MNKKKNYYVDVLKGFQKLDYTWRYVRAADALFVNCQQYYWNYGVREKMKDAERVLKIYYDENDYIAKRKLKGDSFVKPKYELQDKLYLEFRNEIFGRFYQGGKKFADFLNVETFREDVGRCFKTEPTMLLENLADIWKYAKCDPDFENTFYEKHDCRYIHNAMNIVRDALDTELPPIDVSVEAVISKEWLEKILDYLNEDCLPGAAFTVAPIAKALGEGTYHKYIQGNRNVFFNLKSDYNLSQLKNRVDATKRLLEEYDSIMKELDSCRQQFKAPEEFHQSEKRK